MPVNGKIDILALEQEVDAIWAAAVNAYKSGEQWWLTDDEAELVEQSNASYSYEHPWYQAIKSYLDIHGNVLKIEGEALRSVLDNNMLDYFV